MAAHKFKQMFKSICIRWTYLHIYTGNTQYTHYYFEIILLGTYYIYVLLQKTRFDWLSIFHSIVRTPNRDAENASWVFVHNMQIPKFAISIIVWWIHIHKYVCYCLLPSDHERVCTVQRTVHREMQFPFWFRISLGACPKNMTLHSMLFGGSYNVQSRDTLDSLHSTLLFYNQHKCV